MTREIEYNLVVISDYKNNKYFVGKIPWFNKSTGFALLYNFLDFKSKNTGECPYKKLSAYHESKSGKLEPIRYNDKRSKDDLDKLIYKFQLDLISKYGEDCLLNDIIISPEKYKCLCGMMVHEQFRQAHESKYCSANKLPELPNIDDF